MQQGDVNLFQTDDGGEILITDGVADMTGGFGPAVYLSLFGGNEDDNGQTGNPQIWWGSLDDTDPAFQYRSETQHILQSLPATSGNMRRLEDAARRDLEWFLTKKIASSVTVLASIPALNRARLVVSIEALGRESEFEYTANWKAKT